MASDEELKKVEDRIRGKMLELYKTLGFPVNEELFNMIDEVMERYKTKGERDG